MSDNQFVFEIIRDVGYLIQDMQEGETVWFNVTRDSDAFHTARSSKGMPCGLSETSRAIKQAYKVTRNCPDERDTKITELRLDAASKQAQIDSLMLEYCPDEMSQEQIANWEAHQVPVQEE
jgi:hypothetical protein